jgi:uncharacterized membrane protein
MLERTVEMRVERPLELVYKLWADMENLPQWMEFVQDVKIISQPGEQEISRWRFGSGPLSVTWTSRTTRKIPLRLIAWESISGLKNRGQIEFFPEDSGCRLKLALAFETPGGVVGAFLEQVGVARWIDENLVTDLKRFKALVEGQKL